MILTLPDFTPKDYPDADTALNTLHALVDDYVGEVERQAFAWHNEQMARVRQYFKPRDSVTESEELTP
jgi:hypothetical protein